MSSTIHESSDDLRIRLAAAGRELIARPFGPLFRIVSVADAASDRSAASDRLRVTSDLDAAAVDALILRLAAWRAEQAP